MTNLALVGDIGGTNSRFGLFELSSMAVRDVEVLKNDNFAHFHAAQLNKAETRIGSADITHECQIRHGQLSATG